MTTFLALAILQGSPADTVRTYVAALTRGDFKTAAGLVQGGVYSDPARRLGGYLAQVKDKKPFIKLLDVEARESGDVATATVHIGTFKEDETSDLTLTRGPEGWRIVPNAVDPSKPKLLPGITLGFVQPMVFLAIVAPIEVQEKRHQDLLGIKLVGTALLIWSGDHDDRLPKPGENIATLLAPYLKDKSLVQRLKSRDWLLNDALRGRTFLEFKDLSKVVMLYESAGGKGLGPGGRKLIVFADGSAILADAARLSQVHWTIKP